MDFLRLYFGEIASLVLVLVTFFVASAIASRHVTNRRMIRNVRNLCIAIVIGAFASSWTYSLLTNRAPRGQVNRVGVDQDQKAFELRHSGEKQ
jgi:hypothetical protein